VGRVGNLLCGRATHILAFMPSLSVTYIPGWLQCKLQCYKCAQSYSLESWITGNFPSYCMHEEYFLIKRRNLQWKESCHWEHYCGLIAEFSVICGETWPPLWSSGQSSWLQIRRPGFDSRHYQKKSCGSGTGSTQPHEYNWGIRHADHVAPFIRKSWQSLRRQAAVSRSV
jgi:hypothetical protein